MMLLPWIQPAEPLLHLCLLKRILPLQFHWHSSGDFSPQCCFQVHNQRSHSPAAEVPPMVIQLHWIAVRYCSKQGHDTFSRKVGQTQIGLCGCPSSYPAPNAAPPPLLLFAIHADCSHIVGAMPTMAELDIRTSTHRLFNNS